MEWEMERDDYKFLKIRDAVSSINQKVNLIGVVVEFGLPKKSKGTDYFCTLKISDETYPKGISVNFFAASEETLPRVLSPGDIIELSRVVMKAHNDGIYAHTHKKFSTFALYQGKGGVDFVPYQTSPTFRLRDQASTFVTDLRKWLVAFQVDEGSNNFVFLRDLKEGERVDLVCKVLHVCEVAKDEWTILVWDGTDTPPISIDAKLEDEMNNPLPLQLEPFNLPRDLLSTLPTVGTILHVIIDKGNEKHLLHLLNAGKWMKLLNILCEVHAGLWRGVITSFTRIRYLPDEDSLMVGCQRCSMIVMICLHASFCPSEVDFDHVPFVTLMDVLTSSKATAKFKCVVRVVAIFPWRVEDFRSHDGTYRIRLTIEDPTARIHALIYDEDGVKFFDGYPSVDILNRKRNTLLGVAVKEDGKEIEVAPRNPPWVQCCLKSYYLDKNDIWGSRQYRIFGTKHVG
ncbi:hypothetical protein Tsubulata_020439 [Turnera subulata]|uniref:Protection of telomeres protein 1 n=1 Tax=Turnera subulata TaxID=218843 RepID=A0A9Q0JPH8_9ROSI|nr:hypothetical protein Tsubulata_020439 [Turnera subulata]